jgi:two-component system response regulator HydG
VNHILIVEDEDVIRSALRRFLEKQGFEVQEAGSVEEASRKYDLQQFSLIISDLRLPGPAGTDIIGLAEEVPVLIMTSYASMKSAVDTMKLGAADYIPKPFNYEEMLQTIHRIINEHSLNLSAADIEQPIDGMLGTCPAMLELFTRINKVAPTDTTVLIEGESGTGKELVARALHSKSGRSGQNMISLNCAAIPDTLIESELFGHEKGAFTGATAMRKGLVEASDGSTLFLDEIGELPLEAQARLLRVLQEGEVRRVGSVETRKVDVRLIAATHRNLKQLTTSNEFREDLYYRLNVVRLTLPPLRDRQEDLIHLAQSILKRTCIDLKKAPMEFTPAAIEAICAYRWPGNVRELENAVARAVILCEGKTVSTKLLAIDVDAEADSRKEDADSDYQERDLSLEDYFQRFVVDNQDHMTETELAEKLGISRKSLWEKRQKLNLPRVKPRNRST